MAVQPRKTGPESSAESTAASRVVQHPIVKWDSARVVSRVDDTLAVEEPLEIRLGGRRFTLTMRTPGNDDELAAGFLFAEGFVEGRGEIDEIRQVRDSRGHVEANVIDVVLRVPSERMRTRLKRNFVITSSCGVCGKGSIEALSRRIRPMSGGIRVAAQVIQDLPKRLRGAQQIFSETGGLHAAGLFDADGSLRTIREDVGRHNAVDKVIGRALLDESVPLGESLLMVSGRISFELVQKAAAAGIATLCAISAPSSLAVHLADEVGMTLVGFIRSESFNVYSHTARIVSG